MPREIPPDFIDEFVYLRLGNGHGPNVIAHTLALPAPSISTRWLYELIDRAHRNGDAELASLLRRKYKKIALETPVGCGGAHHSQSGGYLETTARG